MKLEAMLKVTLFACITVSYVCLQDAGGLVSHGDFGGKSGNRFKGLP